MTGTRRVFHHELRDLELRIQGMGAAVQEQVEHSVKGLASNDDGLSRAVIEGDDDIDAYFIEIENKILDLFALQTPVASDLRLLTVLLHINLHLERVGDMAVNVAKLSELSRDLPRNDNVLKHLEEMGAIDLKLIAAAMQALADRDLALCERLTVMDDPIDRLNRGMMDEVLAVSDDKRMLEWAIRMHVVSRQLERVGDHAVDIGEQVAFLITGEFREF
ncbi:MAG TPA: phosphate signaling complex protein PhoU, partial [Actinomycetota bacterium]|nr:phosphate signaling complex protein PhoU [Actinomycetota bacterium]